MAERLCPSVVLKGLMGSHGELGQGWWWLGGAYSRCRLVLTANKWQLSAEVVDGLRDGVGWGWRHTSGGQMGTFIRGPCVCGVALKSSSER